MKEKEIKRSFLEISKRFLEPLKSNKVLALKSFIKMTFRGINPISHIFFIQKIVYQIENKNYESFKLIFIYYILYIIIYEISELIMIKWGWYGAVESYKKSINEKYILKYIKLNNNSLEKIGTGKLISIVEKGVEIWGIWLNFFIENIVQIFVVLVFSVYVIFKFSNFYGLLFLLIYIFLIIIGNILNKKMIFYRNKRKDSQTNYTRQFVKIIMSKFEIM